MTIIQTSDEITSTNIMWEFYLKYYKKYAKNINEIIMKKPRLDIMKIIDIIKHNHDAFDIFYKLNIDSGDCELTKNETEVITVNFFINCIRTQAECLKKINALFFSSKHIDKYGNVEISNILQQLKYNSEDSKKITMLLFHDLRNALSHIDYKYSYDENNKFKFIIWHDKNGDSHELSLVQMTYAIARLDGLLDMYRRLYNFYYA